MDLALMGVSNTSSPLTALPGMMTEFPATVVFLVPLSTSALSWVGITLKVAPVREDLNKPSSPHMAPWVCTPVVKKAKPEPSMPCKSGASDWVVVSVIRSLSSQITSWLKPLLMVMWVKVCWALAATDMPNIAAMSNDFLIIALVL